MGAVSIGLPVPALGCPEILTLWNSRVGVQESAEHQAMHWASGSLNVRVLAGQVFCFCFVLQTHISGWVWEGGTGRRIRSSRAAVAT